jgi:hypothetical protein
MDIIYAHRTGTTAQIPDVSRVRKSRSRTRSTRDILPAPKEIQPPKDLLCEKATQVRNSTEKGSQDRGQLTDAD